MYFVKSEGPSIYFITDKSAGAIDGNYSIEEPWIRDLMGRIYSRGHEIGLHTSYNSYKRPKQIRYEFHKLLRLAEQEDIRQIQWGGRQHYLRWRVPDTWQGWSDAGLFYDSTLTYAEHVGFRAGICYQYPVYNLCSRQTLALPERPLVVMDGSLLSKSYMNLPIEDALTEIRSLAYACKAFRGQFTLLWHNSELVAKWQRRLYETVLEEIL
jgi:peptidoglycan/xylan/chitin deacetylase (PgdA/CDA1 family)